MKLMLYYEASIFLIVLGNNCSIIVITAWEHITNDSLVKQQGNSLQKNYTHLNQFVIKQPQFTLKMIPDGFMIIEIKNNKHIEAVDCIQQVT